MVRTLVPGWSGQGSVTAGRVYCSLLLARQLRPRRRPRQDPGELMDWVLANYHGNLTKCSGGGGGVVNWVRLTFHPGEKQ